MSVEWALSIVLSMFKVNGYVTYCSCHGTIGLLEHEIKVVERVLERKILYSSDCP